MIAIAGIFWTDSRYPALMKRYNTGTAISAKGSLTFGLVYTVDRSMPLQTRVWRTTVNWLDANRVGIWGLSYGGVLTAQALARNSDIFKVGVDLAGVHLWGSSLDPDNVSYTSSAISAIR